MTFSTGSCARVRAGRVSIGSTIARGRSIGCANSLVLPGGALPLSSKKTDPCRFGNQRAVVGDGGGGGSGSGGGPADPVRARSRGPVERGPLLPWRKDAAAARKREERAPSLLSPTARQLDSEGGGAFENERR